MKRKANICRICLRADRKLKTINDTLLEFHNQLCEYSAYTLNPLYCMECEHLLRKTCNFKNKCMKALRLFEKWKKSKQLNKSMNDLHTLLPTSLAPWIFNDHSACISYEYNEENIEVIQSPDRSEAYQNTFNIVILDIGFDSDIKELIKTEDLKNSENHLKNQQDNDIEVVSNSKQNDVKTENEIPINDTTKINNQFITKGLENHQKNSINLLNESTDNLHESNDLTESNNFTESNYNVIESNYNVIESNDNIVESNDYLYASEGDFDSDDSLMPLSIACKKKTKDVIKKNAKKCERKRLKNGSDKSKRKKMKLEPIQFSKERLKTELEAKFELWGELTTEDGTVIDKTVIMDCLNDKITDERMKQLWDSIQCETPNPVTIRTFKHLMRNYTNEEQYSTVFDIEYLNTEEKMHQELLRRKTYECYLTAKYRCEICYLVFYKPKHLDNHTKMHQEGAGEFVCKICGLRFASSKNLRSHVASHGAAYKCKLCPLVTYYRDSMVNHYNQHEGKSYTCESCGKVSKSMSGYKRHQYLSHRRGRHVCTTCGRAFVSELGVALHKTRMHQNETPPSEGASIVHCTECDLSFPSEEVLMKHKRTWHNEHKAVKKTKRARPNNPKPPSITCRVCSSSGSIGWLTLHFRTEHPTLDMNVVYADKRKHLCHICAKGFWNATSLRYHLNSHSGVRPYACDLCPKRYHSGVALNEHKLRHFPPGKECKQCGKKFKTQSNLTNHMLFHTGMRRHKCSFCGKAFLHSTSLNEHIRGVHYNVRRVKKGARGGKIGEVGVSGGEMSD